MSLPGWNVIPYFLVSLDIDLPTYSDEWADLVWEALASQAEKINVNIEDPLWDGDDSGLYVAFHFQGTTQQLTEFLPHARGLLDIHTGIYKKHGDVRPLPTALPN